MFISHRRGNKAATQQRVLTGLVWSYDEQWCTRLTRSARGEDDAALGSMVRIQYTNCCAGNSLFTLITSLLTTTPFNMVTLHPAYFPHIAEMIIAHLDSATLVSARLVEPTMRDFADAALVELCDHILIQSRGADLIFLSEGTALPFFHPSSPPDRQHAAMRHARTVTIGLDVSPSARLNELLAQLDPDAEVTIKHGLHGNSRHILPSLARVELEVYAACRCSRGLDSPFQHKAREVAITVRPHALHAPMPLCGLLRGVVQEGVHSIHIRTWRDNMVDGDTFLRRLLLRDGRVSRVDATRELFRLGVRKLFWLHWEMAQPAVTTTASTAGASSSQANNTNATATAGHVTPDIAAQAEAGNGFIKSIRQQFRHHTDPSGLSTAALLVAFFTVTYMAARPTLRRG